MKTPILSFTVSALIGIGIVAAAPLPQDAAAPQAEGHRGGGMMNPDRQIERLTKTLKLSDDQASQIKPILADTQSKLQDLRNDTSLSREDRMAKVKSIREDGDAKINAVLNDDQKAKYAKMQAEQRERMQQHRQGGEAPATNQ